MTELPRKLPAAAGWEPVVPQARGEGAAAERAWKRQAEPAPSARSPESSWLFTRLSPDRRLLQSGLSSLPFLPFSPFSFLLLTSCSRHRGGRQESPDARVRTWVTGAKPQVLEPAQPRRCNLTLRDPAQEVQGRKHRGKGGCSRDAGQGSLLPEAEAERSVTEGAALPLLQCLGSQRRQ